MCVAYTQSNRFSCSSFYIYIKRENKCSTTKIVFDRSVYLVVLLLVRSIWWGLFMRGIESTPADDFPTIFTLHNLWISEKDKNHPTQWRKCVMRMTTGVGRRASGVRRIDCECWREWKEVGKGRYYCSLRPSLTRGHSLLLSVVLLLASEFIWVSFRRRTQHEWTVRQHKISNNLMNY